ncbi:ATP-binding SpoIIE family protein phosphatase [Streptomyces radiopugnans]|uniref:Serine phosphatase RsbU, regulator of sigma subunit n=1 Tax=Streptomyces radiopugnans TaxID=403935 RepID=A0A1H9JBV5_9ACTN|nr:SpoIIE family protein phosphatase [Streptomyces radiopugnans]SEQ84326.1 Serine phosphatase RsbU, regulator of sigma subunit [Streptomyces radiopugnans]
MTGRGGLPGTGAAGWGQPAELVLDAAGAVMMCTRPVLELLGGSAGELCGRELGSFLEDPSEWAGLAESAGHGRRSDGRVVLRRVGGGRVDVDVSVFALAGGGGARFLVWLVPVAGAELEDRFGMRVALTGGGVLASSPRAQQRLDLLHAAAVRVGGSLDVARNAEELVDLLVPVFADLGAVDLTEEVLAGEELGEFAADAPMRRVAVAAGEGLWPEEVYGLGETFSIGDVEREHLLRGSAGIMPDLSGLRRAAARDPRRSRLSLPEAATSLLVLPLRARGTVLGAVPLWRTGDRTPFDRGDATLAEEIGSRLALGLDNARRYTRERSTAEALQRSLLPPPVVRLAGAETSGMYAPASTAAGTGGSWYDVIRLSGVRVAFVVGKVAGHGVNAAGAMGRLRSAVQTLADLDPPPDELLSHLDDLVTRIGEDERHRAGPAVSSLHGATCLYAAYDPVTGRCLVASAGHPGPVLARRQHCAADSVELRPGPPLGGGTEPFEPVELLLRPGDIMAFHSGPLTAAARNTERDLERMCESARTAASTEQPLSEVGPRLLARLREQNRDEDLALLLARVARVPPEDTAFWRLPADPSLVAHARALTSAQLAEWDLGELDFTTELIVSELVTNAVRYAGGPIGLRLIRDHRLVCEVSDPSQSQPYLRRARLSEEGGRGLFLISQLAHRWGSRYTPGGKTIWTEQLTEGP